MRHCEDAERSSRRYRLWVTLDVGRVSLTAPYGPKHTHAYAHSYTIHQVMVKLFQGFEGHSTLGWSHANLL
jgi:hypothetical protein